MANRVQKRGFPLRQTGIPLLAMGFDFFSDQTGDGGRVSSKEVGARSWVRKANGLRSAW